MNGPAVDPHNHLRAAARARAEHTVTRLQVGIQAIQERHEQVTARTIERETGLTFKTIQRNAAAYDLYSGAADVFRQRSKRQPNRRGPARSPKQPVRDALLAYKKQYLVERLRVAMQRIETLETALAEQAATCQEQHLQTILSLRVENHRLEWQRAFSSTP
jgi:hypothetical protein